MSVCMQAAQMRELRQEVVLLKDSIQAQGKLTAGMAAERDAAKASMAESSESVQVYPLRPACLGDA